MEWDFGDEVEVGVGVLVGMVVEDNVAVDIAVEDNVVVVDMVVVGMVDRDVARKAVEDMVCVETVDMDHQYYNLEWDSVHNYDGYNVDDGGGYVVDSGCNSDTDSCYSFDTDSCCNGLILFHIRKSI